MHNMLASAVEGGKSQKDRTKPKSQPGASCWGVNYGTRRGIGDF